MLAPCLEPDAIWSASIVHSETRGVEADVFVHPVVPRLTKALTSPRVKNSSDDLRVGSVTDSHCPYPRTECRFRYVTRSCLDDPSRNVVQYF